MASFLTEVQGFTPVIDAVVKDTSLMTAVVYGRVWRYCQMEDRVCKAALETIGAEIGVSRRTVERHIKALCSQGYLIDTTPGRRNAPHIYADTGKLKIAGLLSVQDGKTESPTNDVGKTESPSRSDRESDLGRTESTKKIDIKIDSKKDNIHAGEKPPTPAQAMFTALASVCRINTKLLTKTQRIQLNQTGKILRKEGIEPPAIQAFGEWWFVHDWRGQKKQSPQPHQVREVWDEFIAWKDGTDGTSINGTGAYGEGHFATGMGGPITEADFTEAELAET